MKNKNKVKQKNNKKDVTNRKSLPPENKKIFGSLNEETRHSVLAVIFLVLGIFFVFASWGKSGVVGKFVYGILETLVGIGYFVLPLLMFMLGISFFKSMKPSLLLNSVIGAILFFLSCLGFISLVGVSDSGGIIGKFVSIPLVKLFDVWISGVILTAFILISIMLMFDRKISLGNIFNKEDVSEESGDDDIDEAVASTIAETKNVDAGYEQKTNKDGEDEKSTQPDKKSAAPIKEKPKNNGDESDINLNQLSHLSGAAYIPPPISLLEADKGKPGVGDIKANANIIKRTLQNFGINVEMDEISIGPSVTRYALKPAEGVKLSRIVALQNDLGLALAAHPIRIEAPIPGKSLVGIEVPNSLKTTVGLAGLMSSDDFAESPKPLLLALGKGVSGKSFFADLAKIPHLLIAGATGSGKSVTIHAIITSLLYRNSPENMRFIMVDPKRVELTLYNKTPHLLTPVITDPKKAILALKWAAKEMDRRYDILESESVRDIGSYHKNILLPAYAKIKEGKTEEENLPAPMPYIVIIIDELADIMVTYPRELESAIVRLAQMSRAVGIHLILSTQRPSVNVITGLIKANVPGRIAMQVASQIDSRTILDSSGAEKLLGAGDMLYVSGEMSKPVRIQCAFVTENEVKKVVKFLASNALEELGEQIDITSSSEKNSLFEGLGVSGDSDGDDDELYEEAMEAVIKAGKASSSYLQRKLKVGYARAARLMDMLEERGVIGAQDGSKPREVIDRGSGFGKESGENNEQFT